jgi:peptidoglycan hydrolase-like protein with peptidoglycan-binding domain
MTLILAAATTTTVPEPEPVAQPTCEWYLTAFIREGAANDTEQVKRLQSVLKDVEGAAIEVNGTYDKPTLKAVHEFQTKYKDDILTPWGESKSTGFVYLTTRKKVNEVYCRDKQFPLSAEEQAEVDRVRTLRKNEESRPIQAARTTRSAAPLIEMPAQKAESAASSVGAAKEKNSEKSQAAAVGSTERSLDRVWRPISDFFGRIFGR